MEEKQNSQVFAYVNAFLQLGAIIISQYAGIVWPIYVVMALLTMLIVLQTLGIAILISNALKDDNEKYLKFKPINLLVSILYLMSSYNIYMFGFVGFAWVAGTHSVIHLFTSIIGVIKK